MRRVWSRLGAVAVVVLAIGACRNPMAPDQSVVLDVSKLAAPASIAAGTPLSVVLTVVTGGCRTFDHIEIRRDASAATVTAWGKDVSVGRKNVACTADIRLKSESYQIEPPFANVFTVTVTRPQLAPLTATVQVE